MEYIEVISDLTITIPAGESELIKINGKSPTVGLGVALLTAGATFKVQTSLNSSEFVDNAAAITELDLEGLWIGETETTEFTAELKSKYINAPNFIYIENTSTGTEGIRASIRLNR